MQDGPGRIATLLLSFMLPFLCVLLKSPIILLYLAIALQAPSV